MVRKQMYSSNKRKIGIVILTAVLLVAFLYLMEKTCGDAARLDRRIQNLGKEEFQIGVFNEGLSFNRNNYIIQDVCVEGWLNDRRDTFYFFMPSAIEEGFFSGWKFIFNEYKQIQIDGKSVVPGDDFVLEEGTHILTLGDGTRYALEVLYSKNIGSLFVEIDSGSLEEIRISKEKVAAGTFYLFDSAGKMDSSGILQDIHTRGNLSFTQTRKKSFAIQLEQEEDFFGMEKCDKWLLMANSFDDTLSRNFISRQMARTVGMSYVPDAEYVDLYIDGEYQGNYQLTEKVEIADGRIEIRNLEEETKALNVETDIALSGREQKEGERIPLLKYVDIEYEPKDITCGYLLELDMAHRFENEVSGFLSAGNQPVVMKSPEYAGVTQVSYVANLYQDMEDALNTFSGYNETTQKYYYDYMDIRSFAQKYLIDEVTKNTDASLTSFYLYIPNSDGKFYAGPIWDYDQAFGIDQEKDGILMKDPEGLFASIDINLDVIKDREHSIFYALCQHVEFQEEYKKIYFDVLRDATLDILDTDVKENAVKIRASFVMDTIRWQKLEGIEDKEVIESIYDAKQEEICLFLKKRIEFLDEVWK